MYVNRKSPTPFVPKRDSSSYFFAGDAGDIKKVLQTLRVPFRDSVNEQTWTNVYGNAGGTGQPVLSVNRVRKELMPNVRGMGLRDALYMLESLGLKVTIKGKGKVISQSVSPGTAINRNLAVVLDLG